MPPPSLKSRRWKISWVAWPGEDELKKIENSMQDAPKPSVTGERTVMSEFDSSSAVFKSRAKKLASLLASGEERTKLWRVDELAAIFRHQMSAPILVDLGTFDPLTATRIRMQSEAQGLLLKSFADL